MPTLSSDCKSSVRAIHEYSHRHFKEDVRYIYDKRSNEDEVCATVMLNGLIYTSQGHMNKHTARALAAKATAEILFPQFRTDKEDNSPDPFNLKVYDSLNIGEEGISDMRMQPEAVRPYSILLICTKRNFLGGESIVEEKTIQPIGADPPLLEMRVGSHLARVPLGDSARDAAALGILRSLHPHLKTWGSLIRMYLVNSARSVKHLPEPAGASLGTYEHRVVAAARTRPLPRRPASVPLLAFDTAARAARVDSRLPGSTLMSAGTGFAPQQLRVIQPDPHEAFITERSNEVVMPVDFDEYEHDEAFIQASQAMDEYAYNLFHSHHLGNGLDVLGHFPADVEAGFNESEWEEI